MDRGVVEPVGAEHLEVLGSHVTLMQRQPFRVGAKRAIGLAQVGLTPTPYQRVHERVRGGVRIEEFLDLFPEVFGVRLSSVEAVVQL